MWIRFTNVLKDWAIYNLRQHYAGKWWTLFAISAFPLHLWTLIQVFNDYGWLTIRSNSWDAIGVGAYGLLFALLESAFVFVVVLLLGLLIHPKWGISRRVALLSILILLAASWAMLNQLYFLLGWSAPLGLVNFLAGTAHPLRYLYALVVPLVLISIALPVYFLLRSDKALQIAEALIERLTLLSSLYLVLDFVALAMVVTRNL